MANKVAVITVHGIGRHAAGETLDAMANLLFSMPGRDLYGAPRNYRYFEAKNVQIALQPVKTAGGIHRPAKKGWWYQLTHLYQEQSAEFADHAKQRAVAERPGCGT